MSLNYNWSLKKAIVNREIEQRDLAEMIGKNPSFISQLVNGRILATEDEKKLIAQTLGVKVSDIFES